MSKLLKQEVKIGDLHSLCKLEAKKHKGWRFINKNNAFELSIGKHSKARVYFRWVMYRDHLECFVCYGVYNYKMELIHKDARYFSSPGAFTRPVQPRRIANDPFSGLHNMNKSFFVGVFEDCIPDYIHAVFTWAETLIHREFDFSSERALLENLPTWDDTLVCRGGKMLELAGCGDSYCFAKILLGDFHFVDWYFKGRISIMDSSKNLYDENGEREFWIRQFEENHIPRYKELIEKQGHIYGKLE